MFELSLYFPLISLGFLYIRRGHGHLRIKFTSSKKTRNGSASPSFGIGASSGDWTFEIICSASLSLSNGWRKRKLDCKLILCTRELNTKQTRSIYEFVNNNKIFFPLAIFKRLYNVKWINQFWYRNFYSKIAWNRPIFFVFETN